MKMKTIVVGIMAMLLTGPAIANSGAYIGLGATMWDYDQDGVGDTLKDTSPALILGSHLHENLALESRLILSGSDDTTVTVGSTPVDVELEVDEVLSVFLRPQTSGDQRVYGLLGYTRAEFTATASAGGVTASESDDDSGLSYGVGVEARLAGDAWLGIEHAVLIDDSDFEFSATTVGLRLTF